MTSIEQKNILSGINIRKKKKINRSADFTSFRKSFWDISRYGYIHTTSFLNMKSNANLNLVVALGNTVL